MAGTVGRLSWRVAFDRQGTASDGAGGVLSAWQEQFVLWAELFNAGGSEAVMAARLDGRTIVRVRLRASSMSRLITTDWRMRDVRTGEVWNIREVDPFTEARAWVLLRCEKGVAT